MGYPLFTSDSYPVYTSDNYLINTSDTEQTNLVAKAIRLLTRGKISYTPEGSTTHEDLNDLLDFLSGEINRKNPGFTSSELARFSAYLVLDILDNSQGTGNIIEKKVKDVSWKVARSQIKGSSSVWYDYAEKMIASYTGRTMPVGVARADSYMQGFDSTPVDVSGDPAYTDRPDGW